MDNEVELFDALCRENLEVFLQRAFRVLEPGTAFEYNWHIGCLTYDQRILTEHGYAPIGYLVESGYSGKVLSYNHDLNILEWKKVTQRMKNNGRTLYELVSSEGDKITLTDNHPVWANGKYTEASKVQNGDCILRLLPETISESALVKNEILRDDLLWEIEDKGEKPNLPQMLWEKASRFKNLLGMQREENRERIHY